ncbi:MAG: hypothetical protein HUU35_01875 [Armatimonadetes bacterium]|nr:hypothetical protein [Armatimonadota bacterium]
MELVLMLKNLCFNLVTVLTVLVALGNELRRWRMTFKWLEERQEDLRRAWYISLAVYLGLSALYSGLAHKPLILAVDVVTAVVMVGAVTWLKGRQGGPLVARDEPADGPDQCAPRRPMTRVPRSRPETDWDEPAPRRVPRERRRSTRRSEPDEGEEF